MALYFAAGVTTCIAYQVAIGIAELRPNSASPVSEGRSAQRTREHVPEGEPEFGVGVHVSRRHASTRRKCPDGEEAQGPLGPCLRKNHPGDVLRRGPPPAWVRGRWAAGGLEPWPQVDPGIVRGARAAAGL